MVKKIKTTSERYIVFQESLVCYKCGIVGKYFAIEKTPESEHYHLNLYGINDNEEVLFTKDHLMPKSKGGKNHISNYKTCCEICNKIKADNIDV